MAHTIKRLKTAVPAMFLVLLFALSVCVPQVNAADTYDGQRSAVLYLNGCKADGNYELNTEDLYLFSLEGTAPGDSWTGSVNVKNETDREMAVAVHSIASTLKQDTTLFDVLDLRISVEGETRYQGDYAAKGRPVTGYSLIHPGEEVSFDIQVTFPAHAGNECQGKQMDSTWTFHAVYAEPSDPEQTPSGTDVPSPEQGPSDDIIQTGRFMITSNTELITWLIVFLSSGAGLIWMTVRDIKARKSERTHQTSEAQKDNCNRREEASQCKRN